MVGWNSNKTIVYIGTIVYSESLPRILSPLPSTSPPPAHNHHHPRSICLFLVLQGEKIQWKKKLQLKNCLVPCCNFVNDLFLGGLHWEYCVQHHNHHVIPTVGNGMIEKYNIEKNIQQIHSDLFNSSDGLASNTKVAELWTSCRSGYNLIELK